MRIILKEFVFRLLFSAEYPKTCPISPLSVGGNYKSTNLQSTCNIKHVHNEMNCRCLLGWELITEPESLEGNKI